MELDRRKEAPPLYSQVAKELAEKIESGEYAAGELIPSERELQLMYNVSRMTVRLAMSELVNRNYIECRRGIGTIVIYGKIKENIRQVRSLTEEMSQQGVEMKTTDCVLVKEKLPSIVALIFGRKPMEECLVLKRVRVARGRPLVYSKTYLNVDGVPTEASAYHDSLYALLQNQLHITIARGEDVLEAALSEDTVSEKLQLPDGYPVFKRTRVTYDNNENPLEYSICYYPGDQYKCSVDI
ncbi:MAG: GntR family transcriptional regulator [Clostridia bacterium]|nr:GntR family transcriptional regulator [Clostridia bacterium]